MKRLTHTIFTSLTALVAVAVCHADDVSVTDSLVAPVDTLPVMEQPHGVDSVAVDTVTRIARINFEQQTLDLGFFDHNEPQDGTFTFTNVGNDTLVVLRVSTDCGCTVAEYPHEPIPPGESGEIKIHYKNSNKREGRFRKVVRVRTNGSPSLVRLYVEGRIKRESTWNKRKKNNAESSH